MTNKLRLAVVVSALAILPAGCQFKRESAAPATAPPPTFTGPHFFRGSVGSMAYLENYEPLLVSGYGIVLLPEPTGSAEVPQFLRQHLINQARKLGVGWVKHRDKLPGTPEQLFAHPQTAIVEVKGFIPAGAVPGTRFDLWIKALSQTQTTSLASGTLWSIDLSVGGSDPSLPFIKTAAVGRGSVYIDPFAEEGVDSTQRRTQLREAVVIAGGKATQPQQIRLILNQPGFRRARLVADRINERFSRTSDRHLVARPQDELTIVLWIPPRWQHDAEQLLSLISCLYVQGGEGFELRQAQELADVLVRMPQYTDDIVTAWRGLGRTVIPVLQEYYESKDLNLQLAALEAGAWLGDQRAARGLKELSLYPEPFIRQRVAEALVYLPRSIEGSRTLRAFLDDTDRSVRIAAYETLARGGDLLIDRFPVHDEENDIKFVIDRVPAEKPLIYVTHDGGVPRIAIFNDQLGFRTPMVAKLWDRHLMLRAMGSGHLEVFYQSPGVSEGKTYRLIPTVSTLVYMLGHYPTMEQPQEGLNLTYSRVVEAIHLLAEGGHIDAPIELAISPFAARIAEYEASPEHAASRPEFADVLQPEGAAEQVLDAASDEGRTADPAEPESLPPLLDAVDAGEHVMPETAASPVARRPEF